MTSSKKVFVTSSAFFAFIDRNHPKHDQATACFRYFAQERFTVYTHNFIVIYTYNLLRTHVSFSIAKDFIRSIYLGDLELVRSEDVDEKQALKLILSEQNYDVSFEEALVNVLADRKQIPQICSFDSSRFLFGITPFTLPY